MFTWMCRDRRDTDHLQADESLSWYLVWHRHCESKGLIRCYVLSVYVTIINQNLCSNVKYMPHNTQMLKKKPNVVSILFLSDVPRLAEVAVIITAFYITVVLVKYANVVILSNQIK